MMKFLVILLHVPQNNSDVSTKVDVPAQIRNGQKGLNVSWRLFV
jgi:hypothetical protein